MPPTPDALATTMNKKEAGETPLSQTLLKGIFVFVSPKLYHFNCYFQVTCFAEIAHYKLTA